MATELKTAKLPPSPKLPHWTAALSTALPTGSPDSRMVHAHDIAVMSRVVSGSTAPLAAARLADLDDH